MNVCFVLISDGWGGGENIVHQMISHLIKSNIKVSIILNHEIREYFEDLDVEILDLGSLFDSKSVIQMIFQPENALISPHPKPIKLLHLLLMFFYFFRARERVKNFIDFNGAEILHSHIEYSDILCYLVHKSYDRNVKWISNMHGPWFSLFYGGSGFSSISNFFIIRFLRKAFKEMDRIIFVSQYLYNRFEDIFGELVLDKGLIIRNGIDLSNINRESFSPLEAGFNILFPGGSKLTKGGDILINAVKDVITEIPELNLYIALKVPPDHLIRRLVKKYGLEANVHFVGFLKPKEYLALLNSVDLLAMPSRMEAFGMAYLEAMALGVPIIASNAGGGAEIIKNFRNGILTSPKRDEVAEAILTLYKDKSLRKIISENNLKDIHKFKWNKTVEEYIKTYKKLTVNKE